ncbi:MAG: 6-carboxytetrahydropterin synthase [Bryocella sp.]
MPVVQLSRRYHFSASHRLHVDRLTPERNVIIFGKCNNPYGHGHNYTVQVTFSGPVNPATGMVTDLGQLEAYAQQYLLDVFDHQNLNTLPVFLDVVPTTENLAVAVWQIFVEYPHVALRRVRIEETGNNAFDYYGEGH